MNDGHKGRGIPDVAGNADPDSGYTLVLDGAVTPFAYGGTSAVAPLYAGLVALLEAALGEPLGYLNPNIYAFTGPYVYVDVNDGASNASGTSLGYKSGPGWDACTGFGSIVGSAMETALMGVGLPPAIAVFNGSLYMAWKGMEFDDRIFWTRASTARHGRRNSRFRSSAPVPEYRWRYSTASCTWPGKACRRTRVFIGRCSMAPAGRPSSRFLTSGPVPDRRSLSLTMRSTWPGRAWRAISAFSGRASTGCGRTSKWSPGIGTSVGPSLAVFNGRLYMAWKGELGDQRLFYSNFDGSSWAAQQLIPGFSSEGASLAVFNSALYAAWKGELGDQRLWWSSFNGMAWAAQQQVPGVFSSVGPSLAVFNSALYAVWKGELGRSENLVVELQRHGLGGATAGSGRGHQSRSGGREKGCSTRMTAA